MQVKCRIEKGNDGEIYTLDDSDTELTDSLVLTQ